MIHIIIVREGENKINNTYALQTRFLFSYWHSPPTPQKNISQQKNLVKKYVKSDGKKLKCRRKGKKEEQ
jgi:hypothetical protein